MKRAQVKSHKEIEDGIRTYIFSLCRRPDVLRALMHCDQPIAAFRIEQWQLLGCGPFEGLTTSQIDFNLNELICSEVAAAISAHADVFRGPLFADDSDLMFMFKLATQSVWCKTCSLCTWDIKNHALDGDLHAFVVLKPCGHAICKQPCAVELAKHHGRDSVQNVLCEVVGPAQKVRKTLTYDFACLAGLRCPACRQAIAGAVDLTRDLTGYDSFEAILDIPGIVEKCEAASLSASAKQTGIAAKKLKMH